MLFASSVLRSLPGQAHTRTSKHLRPRTIPLRRRIKGHKWTNSCRLLTPSWRECSLFSLQGQDGEDRPAVHAPHAWTIAHKTQEDGGKLSADLKKEELSVAEEVKWVKSTGVRRLWRFYLRGLVRHGHTLSLSVQVLEVLSSLTAFHPDQMAAVLCGYTGNADVRFLPQAQTFLKAPPFLLPSSFWWWGQRRTTSATCSVFL